MSIVEETTEKWLQCQIDKGMFSDEVAITYPSTGPSRKSVFVPTAFVQGDFGNKGRVKVDLIKRNDKLMAVLPSSRKDIVVVCENDLAE